MKVKKVSALVATLLVAGLSVMAQNSSPSNGTKGMSVSINPVTGAQTYPNRAWTLTATSGTNYALGSAPIQYIVATTNNINIASAANATAYTAWKTDLIIKGGSTDVTFAAPTGWRWSTNTAQPKLTTVSSNGYTKYRITAIGTNVLIYGELFK